MKYQRPGSQFASRDILNYQFPNPFLYFGASYGSTFSMSDRIPRSCGENCPW